MQDSAHMPDDLLLQFVTACLDALQIDIQCSTAKLLLIDLLQSLIKTFHSSIDEIQQLLF